MSTTHKLFGERVNPSKQQLKKKLRQATTESGFQMKPGYLYTVVRAISARVNQNYDGWPSDELKKSYHTFIGKPVFVNHENYDPKTARGVVVAARYVENGRDKYIEVIQEIDAPTFPKLAHEIKTGGLDSVSMGAEAGFTICSVCDNKAVDERDMCHHVMFHKGEMLPRRNAKTGKVETVLCYESCHKLGFFELSYVFDPADETAVASKVMMAAAGGTPQQHYQRDHKEGRRVQAAIHDHIHELGKDGMPTWLKDPAKRARAQAFRELGREPDYASMLADHAYNSLVDAQQGGDDDAADLWAARSHQADSYEQSLNNPGIHQGGKYTKEDFAIDDGKLPWEREADGDLEKEVIAAFYRGATGDENRDWNWTPEERDAWERKTASDQECLPGEDCETGTSGPSGDEVKNDPNLQPMTPPAGGGSSSGPAAGTSSPIGGGAAAGGAGGGLSGATPGGGAPSKDLTEALTRAGIDPSMHDMLSGFAVAEGNNPSGAPTLGWTDGQAGSTLDDHAQALAKQIKDRSSVAGAFPHNGTPEQQASWMATVVGQNGSSSDWQGNAQPARSDYVNSIVKNMPGSNPASPSAMKSSSFEARVLTAAGFEFNPANSQRTQRPGTLPTYEKAHAAFDEKGAPRASKNRTLDYGAGLGHSSSWGHTFEPNPREGFKPNYQRTEDIPDGHYKRVTNLNVLNVVPPDVRDHIVSEIGRVMAPGGHGIITTRGQREVLQTKSGIPADNGDPHAIRVNPDTPDETYQKGFTPRELHEYVSGKLGPGYTVNPLKLGPAGVHIVRNAGKQAATRREAWGETEAPTKVDTLREEGSAPEDDSDDFYHFVESPRELRTPDLSQAAELDRAQDEQGQGPEDMPGAEPQDPEQGQYITLKIPVPPATQSEALPSQPFDAGPAGAPPAGPPPEAPPAGPPGAAPPGPPGPAVVPGAQQPGEPPQQIAASTLAYFNDYFGHRVANWYDAVAEGREMTAAERADYRLQASTLRNTASVSTTNRTPTKGTADMGRSTLASRGKTASQNRRQHFAEGPLTDGGDVSRNDQGEQEEAFISETPPEESVVAPTDDTPNISNTENNLVARVQRGQAQLLRDAQQLAAVRAKRAGRRTAGDSDEAGGPVATTVNPPLSGTDDQSLKGDDFQSANPNDGVVETQPKDASLKAFKTFDAWLARKTGKRSSQHTAATIRRYAEHYANYRGESVQAYFPALGIVLREARKNEKAAAAKRKPNTKGAKMRKRADEKLEVAAPDGRVDVEAPVRNTTDAEAQASQFDTHDFGNNAGDDIAKPDLSTDQNWAPGEANKSASRTKTAGEILGMHCAEAMIEAGLEPNDRKRKYALATEFGQMNRGLILDRIALAERFAQVLNGVHAHYARKVASGGTRGTTRSPIPAGMSAGAPRQMTAGQRRTAANDPSNDSLMFG